MRRFPAWVKQAYTRPWTVRSAKINLATWTGCTVLWFGNIGLNLLLDTPTRWVWLAINVACLFLTATVLRYAVTGLLWRKAEDAKEAEKKATDEAFFSLIMREHGRP